MSHRMQVDRSRRHPTVARQQPSWRTRYSGLTSLCASSAVSMAESPCAWWMALMEVIAECHTERDTGRLEPLDADPAARAVNAARRPQPCGLVGAAERLRGSR